MFCKVVKCCAGDLVAIASGVRYACSPRTEDPNLKMKSSGSLFGSLRRKEGLREQILCDHAKSKSVFVCDVVQQNGRDGSRTLVSFNSTRLGGKVDGLRLTARRPLKCMGSVSSV